MIKTSCSILVLLTICSTGFSQDMHHPEPAFDFLIKYPSVRDFTMNADGNEAYFTIQNQLEELAIIVRMTKSKNVWSSPVMVPFAGDYRDLEPSLSPDGLRLFFSSDRPVDPDSTTAQDFNIWYVERKDFKSEWSSPVNVGAPVNSDMDEFYPCITKKGNLYFTSDREGTTGKEDIFISPWNGTYASPVPMNKGINSAGMEFNAYVDQDEKFMIYSAYARPGGQGSGDLWISYKNGDDVWGPAKALDASINSRYMDYCPFVDRKTSTLYFTSRRSDISKNHFTNISEFESVASGYENGFSRIYKVHIKDLLK